jgi:hypothetical protein
MDESWWVGPILLLGNALGFLILALLLLWV